MSLEPKKPIEELLEATAKARRAQFGADPKMPNPMRAQLHHEITRVARGDAAERPENWLAVWWPRLAFTTVFGLILVSISTLWWWHEHPSSNQTLKLAMQEQANVSPPPEKVFDQGMAAAAAPVMPGLADKDGASSSAVDAANDADALGRFAEATVAPAETAPAVEGFTGSRATSDQLALGKKASAGKDAKPAAPAAKALATNEQVTHFRQQNSKNPVNQVFPDKSKQNANFLTDFEVQQSDHEIRLVDADGSNYSGKAERLNPGDGRSIYNQKKNDNAPSSGAAPSFDEKTQSANAEYYFRAAGFNKTLKKPVEIEGNYIAPAAIAENKLAKAKTEFEERSEQSSARVSGVAKIQGESPVQIDAVAVPGR